MDKIADQLTPEPGSIKYYDINETAARRAKEANSFYSYKPGSATAEYRRCVDEAAQIVQRQKKHVDPMYYEQIDRLLDAYSRKLADNINRGNEIDARVPSVMIAGPSKFPVRRKEKQNAARDKNMGEWRHIQGLLDKIRNTGTGGVSADDPNATDKLEQKLAEREQSQEFMKGINAYYRKNKTLDGCPGLTSDQIESMKAGMARDWRKDPVPFEPYQLSNNNAEIRRLKTRIGELKQHQEKDYSGWSFDGGIVEANKAQNRLQIFFDGKPGAEQRAALKSNGFRWAPSVGAWQRQLNSNAYCAADRLPFIHPATGEKPTELQCNVNEYERQFMCSSTRLRSNPTERGADMPTYTLNELIDMMEPQARQDKEIITNCIHGLELYAAQQAEKDTASPKIAEMRGLIERLVLYWGIDDGENAKPVSYFMQSFDACIEDVNAGGQLIGSYHQHMNAINGLHLFGMEMVAAQGDMAIGDILATRDLIKEMAAHWDIEPRSIVDDMADQLTSEAWGLLPSRRERGFVDGYEIKQTVLFDNNQGFALAENAGESPSFMVWRFFEQDEDRDYHLAHCFETEAKALQFFASRVKDYAAEHGAKEAELPAPRVRETLNGSQDEKPSVLRQIRKARNAPKSPRGQEPERGRKKTGPEL